MNATDGPIKPRRLLTRCGRVQRRHETGTQARIQVMTPIAEGPTQSHKEPPSKPDDNRISRNGFKHAFFRFRRVEG